MTAEPLTRNITRVFRLATDGDRAVGYGWYGRARNLAEKLAVEFDGKDPDLMQDGDDEWTEYGVRKAAGVIAALSPRLAWRKNVEYAELAYMTYAAMQREAEGFKNLTPEVREAIFVGMIPTLNGNARKAYRILSGEAPEDVLGGPKVRAFYFTIVDPSDARAVVVDRHAVSIAYNRPLNDDEISKALGRKAAYDAVSKLYRRAARIISAELGEVWTPAQVQAATWTYWRRERAAAYHGEA
jgi:hypothetical protein